MGDIWETLSLESFLNSKWDLNYPPTGHISDFDIKLLEEFHGRHDHLALQRS